MGGLGVKLNKGVSMSERSLSVSSAIEPVAGGVIGLGVGYSFAPDKYNLQEFIAMPQKKYETFYNRISSQRLTETQKNTLKSLQNARSEFAKARRFGNEDINRANKILKDEFVKIPVSPKNETAYVISRQNLVEAIKSSKHKEVAEKYVIAKQRFEKFPMSEAVKENYYKANAMLAEVKEFLSPKIEAFKTATKKLKRERIAYIKNNPDKTGAIRDAYEALNQAGSAKRANIATRMFELANEKQLIKDFSELKSLLPKSRTKSAIAGAGIFTLLTTFWSSKVSKISQNAA